jgi:hypothetical protein
MFDHSLDKKSAKRVFLSYYCGGHVWKTSTLSLALAIRCLRTCSHLVASKKSPIVEVTYM